ncbi:hypothetical protein BHE90_006027 [Fusarium euwallaceae]|uniref:Zn(2)-C6 fungal-type domain-containing protein n=4 Tax=Fusarium solani species complex TaxID=232080 RepID=A0A3M2SRK2_9HYPO|nr:hypothetical protein CDV36_000285 [Fusarium kuroshium]RSL81646.1 hypothetical protein CEP51_005706 [Fusarium floridanum]RSM01222.1 hypothetical protein CEP52_008679 [Fusarium oligoseptatum]RTE79482.1 hypothetical protein BHE90_006027 [Fusarium euwallaceae]
MDPAAQSSKGLNELACLGCKARKTRCNRAKPTCDGCFARGLTCTYPNKRKRRTNVPKTRSQPMYVIAT